MPESDNEDGIVYGRRNYNDEQEEAKAAELKLGTDARAWRKSNNAPRYIDRVVNTKEDRYLQMLADAETAEESGEAKGRVANVMALITEHCWDLFERQFDSLGPQQKELLNAMRRHGKGPQQ